MTGNHESDDTNRNTDPAAESHSEDAKAATNTNNNTETGATSTGEPITEAELIAGLEKERLRLEKEVADYKDRLLRAHAEMDNVRKRTEREKSDATKYGITKFSMDMLSVADNLQRAMDAVSDPSTLEDNVKAMYDGVALTAQELGNALDKNGVTKIASQGAIFDPHLHQAMMEQPDASVPSGTILQVFQEGYTIGERVLRPAMVVVARGGMKPPKPEAATASKPAGDPEPITPDDDPTDQSDSTPAGASDDTREAS